MEIDESELFEAFGVEPPADPEPLTDPEPPADPEPLADPEPPADQVHTPPPIGPGGAPNGGANEGAGSDIRESVDAHYAAAFAGRVNPYTQKPITSKADYDAYIQQVQDHAQEQRLEQLKAKGIDPAVMEQIISNHPVIQQASLVIRQAQEQQRAAQEVQARNWYAQQLREITALDPEIKTLGDLQARNPDQYPKLMRLVSGGMSLSEAYKGMNFDALAARKAAAAQQRGRNQAAGKAHLDPLGGQGKGAVEVPRAVKEEFLALNPGMTDAEIQAAYGTYLKQAGG